MYSKKDYKTTEVDQNEICSDKNREEDDLDENVEDDLDENVEDDLDENVEDDLDENELNQVKMIDNSEKFVISIDDIPLFYTNSLEKGKICMWNFARSNKRKFFDSNLFIYEGLTENEITLSVKHKFMLVSYERIVCKLDIKKIYEVTIEDQLESSLTNENDEISLSKKQNTSFDGVNTGWNLFTS
jgi:hypothetical protein